MDRRGFLGSILALGAAPAIVRADSLMRIIPTDATLILQNAMRAAWATGGEPEFILVHPTLTEIIATTLRNNSHKFAANIERQNNLLQAVNWKCSR